MQTYIEGEKHTAAAVETRFDANISRVTGLDPNSASAANPVRKVKGRATPMLSKLVAGLYARALAPPRRPRSFRITRVLSQIKNIYPKH
jgi:hypothetical protein